MTRGPLPLKALDEAIPIARARGIIPLTKSRPERIFDIAIISKIPVTFSRVMFAPKILATIHDPTEYYRQEITRLGIRLKHGTWMFFLVTPDSLVEIDRQGKRLESGQTVAYVTGTLSEEEGVSSSA